MAELDDLLKEAGAGVIADVRAVPRSRANPQFNADTLPAALAGRGVGYRHIPALGGLRGRSKGSAEISNDLWRNASFRNYADYAQGPSFAPALASLIELGREQRVAIMCAEALWWRCHRRIIADYLVANGVRVFHIIGRGAIVPASMTLGAKLANGSIIYPAPATEP
ncbi:MAG: DUF488 domain-containing protein [Caulobacteraceae bacterium]